MRCHPFYRLGLLLIGLMLPFGTARAQAPAEQAPPVDGAPAAKSADTPTSASAATEAFLRALEKKNTDVKTIHVSFDQSRYDEVFLEKVDSRGELWFNKPGQLRCEYNNPQPMITLITNNTLYLYTPELKQADYIKFASEAERDAYLHRLLLGFGVKTDELLSLYAIASSEDAGAAREELAADKKTPESTVLFHVKPLAGKEETTPFKLLKVWIDKASMLPEKIWYQDETGANMTLTLRKTEFNTKIDPEQFELKAVIPPGTEFIDKREQP